MLKFSLSGLIAGLSIGFASSVSFIALGAENSDSQPRPIPLTRPEMKELLEDMKGRKPRIPLPELTEEEKERFGGRGGGYEGRLRSLYMPAGEGGFGGIGGGGIGGRPPGGGPAGGGQNRRPAGGNPGGGFGGNADENMTLDYGFKTQLFWIVSRTNNCQYCLGHQESKLLGAGMTEDEIASLDSNWAAFSPKQQAAYAFARKFTFEPHHLSDADIDGLRPHFTDMQILEMILSMSWNNSINRWKEGVGVPQSAGGGNFGRRREGGEAGGNAAPPAAEAHSYRTPTAEKFQKVVTKVAPLTLDGKSSEPTRVTVCNRPPLESRSDVEAALAAAAKRKARLPLVAEAEAKKVLPEDWPAGHLSPWIRLLANFPREARRNIVSNRSADEKGDLSPLLKAQVSWIIARQDRAWYATGEAQSRLLKLNQSADQIYKLDGDWKEFTPAEQAMFTVARKLAASPVVLTDADVNEALKQTSPRDVVQLVSYVTGRAAFDRVTEAAGLPIEE